MQSWWESISRARSSIHALSSVLPPAAAASLSFLADSDLPARALLDSIDAFRAVSASISGAGDDPLCQWLYETFQSPDLDLRLVSLSFLPVLSGLYLSRVVSYDPSASSNLAGFEAVLLSLYASEVKARAGKPVLVSIPDLSQPSLYHTPRSTPPAGAAQQKSPRVGVLSAPLEPQLAVKSTKRACIVAVALDCYHKHISHMPAHSKVAFCEYAASWAGQNCSCSDEFDRDSGENNSVSFNASLSPETRFSDEDVENEAMEELGRLAIAEVGTKSVNGHCMEASSPEASGASLPPRGVRIPLPWELFQPVVRILGHCLMAPLNPPEVKDAASVAVRRLYARAMHDLLPQGILATRSLIQLDKRARLAAKEVVNSASNENTPTKSKKPEILLVSK